MHLQTLLALFPLALAAPANPPLRGSPSLAGYSASNNVSVKNSTGVKYDLVPGQKDKADLGEYFAFEKAENPQPIRGTKGGTDPGPRMLFFFFFHFPFITVDMN